MNNCVKKSGRRQSAGMLQIGTKMMLFHMHVSWVKICKICLQELHVNIVPVTKINMVGRLAFSCEH